MDCPAEDLDELNEETFGSAEAGTTCAILFSSQTRFPVGDWEFEHERFAVSQGVVENKAPEADELPKFWEAPGDLSFLWQPDSFDGVDVEETIQKLVAEDDAFEDPAILDISKKVSVQKLYGYNLEKILDAPAYPTAPVNILGNARDIWSSNDLLNPSVRHGPSETTRQVSDSLSVLHILQQMGRSKASSVGSRYSHTNNTAATFENLRFLAEHSKPSQQAVPSRSPGAYVDAVPKPAHTQSFYDLPRKELALNSSVVPELLPNSAVGSQTSTEQPYDEVSQNNLLKGVPFQKTVAPPMRLNFPPGHFSHPRTFISDARYATFQRMTTGSQPNGSPTFPFHGGVNIFQDPRSLQHLPASGAVGLRAQPPFQISTRMQVLRQPPLRSMFFEHQLARPPPVLFAPQPGPRAAADSFEATPRLSNLSAQFGVRDAKFGIDLQSDEQFNPTSGSWMTQYESVGVLLSHLRPLMVSNPYVQDYYFAVRWLRRMNTNHTKQLLSGGAVPSTCPPVMQMPSPITFQNLIDPTTHYHDVTLTRKFVMPFALVHSLNRLPSPHSSVLFEPVDEHISATDEVSEPQSNSKSPPEHALSGHDSHDVCVSENVPDCHSSSRSISVRSVRRRRLLLARIERMFSLVLNLDEVDVSLARVIVDNEMRTRLLLYRQSLVERLTRELFQSTDYAFWFIQTQSPPPSLSVVSSEPSCCELLTIRKGVQLFSSVSKHIPLVCGINYCALCCLNKRTRLLLYRQSLVERLTRELFQSTDYAFWFIQTQSPPPSLSVVSSEPSCCELLTIRKGVQLFSSVSKHIPLSSLKLCLRELVLKFDDVFAAGTSFTKEYHTQLYPSLRYAIYQMTDMESFMLSCFPEATESLLSVDSVGPNIRAIITSQVSNVVLPCDMICLAISLFVLTHAI
ncbi:hypothetical protein AHF37_02451 [Paragonimus kellicotti]|nr:hypothetical protein AHF37_02451 [Paragonimus kellicotti]